MLKVGSLCFSLYTAYIISSFLLHPVEIFIQDDITCNNKLTIVIPVMRVRYQE